MFSVKSIRVALLCGSLLSALHTVPAQAGDTANVTVTATIVNRTCTPGWSGEQKVDFNTVDVAGMKKPDVAKEKDFTLSLTGCSSEVRKVKVTARGTASEADGAAFKNMATDLKATGLDIYLNGIGAAGETPLDPGGTRNVEYTVSNGAADLKFKFYLTVNDDHITNGKVSVPITLKMDYE